VKKIRIVVEGELEDDIDEETAKANLTHWNKILNMLKWWELINYDFVEE
jgi:hypothetical protein